MGGNRHGVVAAPMRGVAAMRRFPVKAVLAGLLVLLISGCANGSPLVGGMHGADASGPTESGSQSSAAAPRFELSGDLLFALLAGELAVSSSRYSEASVYYGEAMNLTDDSEVAERATRLALFSRDLTAATRAAERWFALDPDNFEAVQISALLQMQRGRVDAAVESLAAIIERFDQSESDDPLVGPRMIAGLLDQVDDGEVADEALDRLIERFSGREGLWQVRVERALRDADLSVAADVARVAAARFPDSSTLTGLHAQALQDVGETEAAGDVLRDANRRFPEDDALTLRYVLWLSDQVRLDEAGGDDAVEALRELALEPGQSAQVLLSAGLAALESEHYEAAEEFLAALALRPDSAPDALYFLGRLRENTNQLEEAIGFYDAVESGQFVDESSLRAARLEVREPSTREAGLERFEAIQTRGEDELALRGYLVAAQTLREVGEFQSALEILARGMIRFPGSLDILYTRGLVRESMDDIDAAEADFRAILESEPHHVSALNALGYTLADRTERFEEAYELIRKAYDREPDDAAVVDSYGWVLYRMGRLEEARTHLERAYSMLADGEIASNYATVLWDLGERAAARDVLSGALAREPEHERLLRVRDRLQP